MVFNIHRDWSNDVFQARILFFQFKGAEQLGGLKGWLLHTKKNIYKERNMFLPQNSTKKGLNIKSRKFMKKYDIIWLSIDTGVFKIDFQ